MDTFQRVFCVSGRIADLPRINEFIEIAAQKAGVDPSAWFDLQLAVEEACTNVIQHAYNGYGGEFDVCFEARGADVVITVHDQGRPFDPKNVVRPDLERPLEERRVGGLGMYLIERLMDQVSYDFSPEGNILIMTKRGVIPAEHRDDG